MIDISNEKQNKFAEYFVVLLQSKKPNIDLIEQCAWQIADTLEPFDWMNWDKGRSALNEPDDILQFSREEVLKTIQMLTREQRFSEGDFSINGKYVSTKNSFFGEMLRRKVLDNLAAVLWKTQDEHCDFCSKASSSSDDVKSMIFPHRVAIFCLDCANTIWMTNPETGEEKTLLDVWKVSK
jgi:hypothetical protein